MNRNKGDQIKVMPTLKNNVRKGKQCEVSRRHETLLGQILKAEGIYQLSKIRGPIPVLFPAGNGGNSYRLTRVLSRGNELLDAFQDRSAWLDPLQKNILYDR
jgi:hypothetical protein